MALDGIFLSKIKQELTEKAVGLRIDKVQQPARDEIVLNLRGRQGSYRLLICVRADSPRIHFTSYPIDNPAVPPMFCMLLRKHLTGALITGIRQLGLDRVLFIDLSAVNEIGDKVGLTLCIEIMGKCSNLILTDENGKIIDSAKRVDFTTSSVRQILPSMQYTLPPSQNKLNIEENSVKTLVDAISSLRGKYLSSAVMGVLEGVSPVVAREIAYRCTGDDLAVESLTQTQLLKLEELLDSIKSSLSKSPTVYMLLTKEGKPKDLSFTDIRQYGDMMLVREYESVSELLDDFYYERDRINRINHRGHELIKLVGNLLERSVRKVNLRREELKRCEEKDKLKLYGELITANIHLLEKGALFYEVPNYYDEMKTVRIPCNPALSPMQNANKYYKDYRKAQTAQVMLEKLIVDGENEISYLESVLDSLSRAATDSELSSIRQELVMGGYAKNKTAKKQRPPKELAPIEFCSTDGYRIFVGRNNIQNDKLSMKTANNNDMWLHAHAFPGSHVIIENKGGEVSDLSIEQAAAIAALYSKASETSLAEVDYTKVRNLKKPVGAKPGKVIYHEYYSIIVKPDKELAKKLFVK